MFAQTGEDSRKYTDLAGRLDFLSIGDAERECLKKLRKNIEPILDESLSKFYDRVETNPELSHFFPNGDIVDSARDRQKQHWQTILSANFGREYVENVTRIGNTHARIGLSPKWYIAGYAVLLDNMISRIINEYGDKKGRRLGKQSPAELGDMVGTLIRVALLDIDLSVSTYLDRLSADREAAQKEGTEALLVISRALDEMTAGNMDVTLSENVLEKAPVLATSFNNLKAGIGGIVAEIRDVSAGVKGSSRSIRNNIETVRERATEQMAAISNITESPASLDRTVTDVLQQMEAASATIETFSEAVAKGNGNVLELRGCITEIATAWQEMLRLVRVISEISTRINMLALNANIEASRAGDYGKGFAVIAESIRELAATTNSAADKITRLAEKSQAFITAADKSGGVTEGILSEIEKGVDVVKTVVSTIDGALQQQSDGAKANHEAASALQKSAVQSVSQAKRMGEGCDMLVEQSQVLTSLVQEFGHSTKME